MKRDEELKKFYDALHAIGEHNPVGVAKISHKKDNNCNEDLIADYLSGVLSPAEATIAEKKIFSCSQCTLLAVELAKANSKLVDDKISPAEKDINGFKAWKEWFAARNSYTIAKSYGGANLRFEGVKGWGGRIHNARQDFKVRIGAKTYLPTADGVIEYPDAPNAVLESISGPTINIREFAEVNRD